MLSSEAHRLLESVDAALITTRSRPFVDADGNSAPSELACDAAPCVRVSARASVCVCVCVCRRIGLPVDNGLLLFTVDEVIVLIDSEDESGWQRHFVISVACTQNRISSPSHLIITWTAFDVRHLCAMHHVTAVPRLYLCHAAK